MRIQKWFGCYAGTRRDLFTQESNRHPAKMAVGLCYRIFLHGQRRGYWKPADWIIDPMCGIFTTGIVGASLNYQVVGVELEKHFFDMASANIELLESKMPGTGARLALIQGDARQFAGLMTLVDGALCSPPYAEGLGHDSGHPRLDATEDERRRRQGCARRSGYSGAVTSPPYATDAPKRDSEDHNERTIENQGKINRHQKLGVSLRGSGYSGAVTSPPYANAETMHPNQNFKVPHDSRISEYGATPRGDAAQIGNLKDPPGDIDAVLSENQKSEIKNQKSQTYLSAMLAVYRELHAVLKMDTIRLMEAVGFTLIERKRAMLAEDLGEQAGFGLDYETQDEEGNPVTITVGANKRFRRERKSFFKRLFENKHPRLAVNWEDVLFFRK